LKTRLNQLISRIESEEFDQRRHQDDIGQKEQITEYGWDSAEFDDVLRLKKDYLEEIEGLCLDQQMDRLQMLFQAKAFLEASVFGAALTRDNPIFNSVLFIETLESRPESLKPAMVPPVGDDLSGVSNVGAQLPSMESNTVVYQPGGHHPSGIPSYLYGRGPHFLVEEMGTHSKWITLYDLYPFLLLLWSGDWDLVTTPKRLIPVIQDDPVLRVSLRIAIMRILETYVYPIIGGHLTAARRRLRQGVRSFFSKKKKGKLEAFWY
jgi:hypothetical protein